MLWRRCNDAPDGQPGAGGAVSSRDAPQVFPGLGTLLHAPFHPGGRRPCRRHAPDRLRHWGYPRVACARCCHPQPPAPARGTGAQIDHRTRLHSVRETSPRKTDLPPGPVRKGLHTHPAQGPAGARNGLLQPWRPPFGSRAVLAWACRAPSGWSGSRSLHRVRCTSALHGTLVRRRTPPAWMPLGAWQRHGLSPTPCVSARLRSRQGSRLRLGNASAEYLASAP